MKETFLCSNLVISSKYEGRLKAFVFGVMEVPKMVCPKEIKNSELGFSSLKVMMRRGIPVQPIKVLLANNGELPIDC